MGIFPISKKDSLSDLLQLVKMVTETHPDPFLHKKSRIEFFRSVNSIMDQVPENIDQETFHIFAMKVMALVGDGHTSMDPLPESREKIWLKIEPIDGSLLVLGVYSHEHEKFIGSVIKGINGIPMETIKENMKKLRGANGENNNLMHIMECFGQKHLMGYLLDRSTKDIGSINLELNNRGNVYEMEFEFSEEKPGELIIRNGMELPSSETSDLSWTILDGRTGYLRIESMWKYRENFESQLNHGASEKFLMELIERTGMNTSGTIKEIIGKIPSASQIITEFLTKMKETGSSNILVDLRDNTGGNSYMANILSYFLFGKRILKVDEGFDVERYSEMYAKQFEIENFESYPGGYNFKEENRWRNGFRGITEDEFEKIVNLSPTFSAFMKSYKLQSGWKVYVLCSARTFSAGFDLLSFMGNCGSTVIGVRPSQAANAFTNTIRFELQNSGLKGWISSKLMVKYPNEPMFYEIIPDQEIGIDKYADHDYATDTIVAEALKFILTETNSM